MVDRHGAPSIEDYQLLLATDVFDGCGGHVARTRDWPALNADRDRLRRIDPAVQVDLL